MLQAREEKGEIFSRKDPECVSALLALPETRRYGACFALFGAVVALSNPAPGASSGLLRKTTFVVSTAETLLPS